jgi:hypothetical protein
LEKLLLYFIVASPIFFVVALYRTWQLCKKALRFKNRIFAYFYLVVILAVLSGFFYIGFYIYKCVWPCQCGEGFASGYIAVSILLGAGIISVGFIFSEIVLFFGLERKQNQ